MAAIPELEEREPPIYGMDKKKPRNGMVSNTKSPRVMVVNGMVYGIGFAIIGSVTSKSSKICGSFRISWHLTNLTPATPWNHCGLNTSLGF